MSSHRDIPGIWRVTLWKGLSLQSQIRERLIAVFEVGITFGSINCFVKRLLRTSLDLNV